MRAYRVAYDGRAYHGFQRQPDVDTVEGRLLSALARLGICERDEVPPGYAAAGRTDAGVSARAQTVAFAAPEWLSPTAFNGELPDDVRAWASADVPADFHATHDAAERTYTYYLYAPRTRGGATADGDSSPRFDDGRWADAVDALAGEHDFHNLTPDDDGTVRAVDVEWTREGDVLVVRFTASGFCRQLVRRLVGLAAAVGRGSADLARVDRVLSPDPVSGPDGVAPAPPAPLVLTDVRYPGVTFAVDEEAAASARAAFEERRGRALAVARVAGHLSDGL
ncbi:tRNA pseudouridine(38-40) synthase TruA [Haloarcula salina]|uniref:tRNA pseudouridine synthase A n=1 Tax=Haloarcula salina TaxID=1429914 RepID=A0AA41FX16_9EURY|nr:tRNA pseudouridine(38-40) synthase TruA [Haloarcula salina]MBV0900362.1 tRNA pseudouridine(38-40) synthase TruA [Haloarcula salina]